MASRSSFARRRNSAVCCPEEGQHGEGGERGGTHVVLGPTGLVLIQASPRLLVRLDQEHLLHSSFADKRRAIDDLEAAKDRLGVSILDKGKGRRRPPKGQDGSSSLVTSRSSISSHSFTPTQHRTHPQDPLQPPVFQPFRDAPHEQRELLPIPRLRRYDSREPPCRRSKPTRRRGEVGRTREVGSGAWCAESGVAELLLGVELLELLVGRRLVLLLLRLELGSLLLAPLPWRLLA